VASCIHFSGPPLHSTVIYIDYTAKEVLIELGDEHSVLLADVDGLVFG
jgi:hypothetical protein